MIELLRAIERRLDVGEIDRLWVFAERRVGSERSTLVVLSAYEESGDRRRVFTARSVPGEQGTGTVPREQGAGNGSAAECRLVEEGIAPPDRIGRLVEGVLRRLDDEVPEEAPVLFEIGGEAERWAAALEDLGGNLEERGGGPESPGGEPDARGAQSEEVARTTKESNNSY